MTKIKSEFFVFIKKLSDKLGLTENEEKALLEQSLIAFYELLINKVNETDNTIDFESELEKIVNEKKNFEDRFKHFGLLLENINSEKLNTLITEILPDVILRICKPFIESNMLSQNDFDDVADQVQKSISTIDSIDKIDKDSNSEDILESLTKL